MNPRPPSDRQSKAFTWLVGFVRLMRRPARRSEAYALAVVGFVSMLVAGVVMGKVVFWVVLLAAAVGLAILGSGFLLTAPPHVAESDERLEEDLAA